MQLHAAQSIFKTEQDPDVILAKHQPAAMKEQVRIHELFHIKKFQPEYITWKAMP